MLTGHGGPEMLEYREDLPEPAPAADEVLIHVAACGMNNTDINTRIGWYSKDITGPTVEAARPTPGADGSWGGGLTFPRIQGADPAGRVVAVGGDVSPDRIGERVLVDAWIRDEAGQLELARYLGSDRDGGFADYVTVPTGNAHALDTDLSDVELASFPCSYATAEHMLERAGVTSGQWVLVTGASGGVGGGLIQLAKRRDANVVAVAGQAKLDRVAAIGADVVIARETDSVAQAVVDAVGKVDVLADVVAGPLLAPLLETVRHGGHYTCAGAIGGPMVELDMRTVYLHDLTMHGATVLPPEVFDNLVGYIERGEIKPIVARVFPLEQMAEAQSAFVKKEHVGAIVIEVG